MMRTIPAGLQLAIQPEGDLIIPLAERHALGWILDFLHARAAFAAVEAIVNAELTDDSASQIWAAIRAAQDLHEPGRPPDMSIVSNGGDWHNAGITIRWDGGFTPGRWASVQLGPSISPRVVWCEGARRTEDGYADPDAWSRCLDLPRRFGHLLACAYAASDLDK